MAEQLDAEMLKFLDLLMHLDVLEQESEWDLMEEMEPDREGDSQPQDSSKKESVNESA
ncbi:MAG: hypothetical protein AB7G93_08800 [Bdellovibrionales bacterium]